MEKTCFALSARTYCLILGEKEIGAVTRADLMKCLDAVTSRGSPRMANVLLNVLKTFYGWAQLREIVIADPLGPVRAADVGGKLPSRDRVLSDAEIDAVLNHKESKGVTQIYQRYDYAKEMADAWAKWGRHLTSLRAQAKGIALVVGD